MIYTMKRAVAGEARQQSQLGAGPLDDSYVQVPNEKLALALANAFAGASTYWCRIVSVYPPERYTYRLDGERPTPHVDAPLNPGGYLLLTDGSRELPWRLDLDALQHGLHLLAVKYPHRLADLLGPDEDQATADLVLQLSLFGELRYWEQLY